MIILQVTFIMLSYTIDIRGFPTMEKCEKAKAALESGEPPEKGHAQRFECVAR